MLFNNGMQSMLFNAALPVYLILTFIRFYSSSSLVFYVVTLFLIAYGLLLLLMSCLREPINSLPTIVVAMMILTALLTTAFSDNEVLLVLPQFLANLGFAWSVVYTRLKPNLFLIIFAIFTLFFGAQIIHNINPEDVFSVSRNFVSVLMILCIAFYYFSCYQIEKRPNIIVPTLGLVIMLWAIGRAGIISGVVLLIGTLLLSKRKLTYSIAVFMVFLGGITFMQDKMTDHLNMFYLGIERFERLAGSGQRDYINSDYFGRIVSDAGEMLFGAPLNKISSIVEVDGNPHNSYIRLHAAFGLLGSIVIVITILTAFITLLQKRCYLLVLIFLVALFRSAFDSTAFHGPLDVVIFYCILAALHSKRIVLHSVIPSK